MSVLVTDFCEGGVEENSADLPAPSLGLCVFCMFLSEHKRVVYYTRVGVCAWLLFWKWKSKESCTCSFYQTVESSFQHSFNYSLCSSAQLRQAGLHATNQMLSHIAAFLCSRPAWSLISHGATLHRSPISYSKGDSMESPMHTSPPPFPPLLVGALLSSIINQCHW